MRLPLALVLIAACSHELAPRPTNVASLSAGSPLTASFAMRLSDEGKSSTTPWSDSIKLGDTTFYSRGRVITTLAVFTDSQWVVGPSAPSSLPSGPANLPPDSLCTLGYTGTNLPVAPATALRHLDRIRECRAKAFAVIRRSKLKDSNGWLSVEATRAELASWPWPGICGRVRDSTIIGFFIGDDVTAKEWGPAPLAVRLAQWDTIGGLIQAECPNAPIVIRALPTQLEPRAEWQSVTTAWAQYAGPRRHGTPEQFFAAQVASAKQQRFGLVAGVNLLNGGCGPSGGRFCLPDIPGDTLPGTRQNLYQVSAAEFIHYKTVAMSDPYVCASVDWAWGPNFRSDFHQRPEIRSAAKTLGVIAGKRPQTSCVQR